MSSDIMIEALGQWPRILEAAGVDPKHLDGNHHPCPVCGGKDRFRFHVRAAEKYADLDKGTYYCNGCGGVGDSMNLLKGILNSGFAEAAAFARSVIGAPDFKPLQRIQHANQETRDLQKIHDSLENVSKKCKRVMPGDTVWRYLSGTRWLELNEVPRAIKFHPNLGYYQKGDGGKMVKVGDFPAMVAVVRAPDGRAVSLHRTYLTTNATKAPVEEPKKLMTCLDGSEGAAIRLFPAGEVLAVAEGIETALAVWCLTGLPVWATISSGKMKSLVVPDTVKTVFIYADHDLPDEKGRRAGQDAARALAKRLVAEGKTVYIRLPKKPGTDFADVYVDRRRAAEKAAA